MIVPSEAPADRSAKASRRTLIFRHADGFCADPRRPSSDYRASQAAAAGFTLIELLVVLVILGVLLAILLPGVQAAREAGRRIQCSSHLRQIGLALAIHHERLATFPVGVVAEPFVGGYDVWQAATNGSLGQSWFVATLPFLEQQAMADNWNPLGNVKQNALVARTDVPLFYCPSRRQRVRPQDVPQMFERWTHGGNDYAGCIGYGNAFWDDFDGDFVPPCDHRFSGIRQVKFDEATLTKLARGIFAPMKPVCAADVRDGLSNTLLLGEHQRLDGSQQWRVHMGRICVGTSHDGWAVGGVSTLFNVQSGAMNNGHFEHPGSEHSGGAVFVLADGSTRFLSEHMSSRVLRALASYDGGELDQAID